MLTLCYSKFVLKVLDNLNEQIIQADIDIKSGFIRGLEKYGKVWNKIWSISRLEKAGKKFFFGLLVWKKKLFFQT